jgi:ribosome-associated heat shock protein Hsp15
MEGLRLDKWLWFARFCKSRSIAQGLIEGGEVRLNGRAVGKASASVKPGDEVIFPAGRSLRRVRVVALGERRGPAPEAQSLYDELPAPVAEPLFDPFNP